MKNEIIDADFIEEGQSPKEVPKRIVIDVGNHNLQTNFDKETTIKILEDAARYLRAQKQPIQKVLLK